MPADRGPVQPAVVTRKRPRKPRVVREPIDLERLAAEFADLPDSPGRPQQARIDEQEILVALQAEVQRMSSAKAAGALPAGVRPELTPAPAPGAQPQAEVVDPFGIVAEAPAPEEAARPVMAPSGPVGLPPDQVRAWLEHVQEDLRRIHARLQQLEAEQARLQAQHHIVAELLTSSTPV
jgi:cell division septum initiation protein DivIVA